MNSASSAREVTQRMTWHSSTQFQEYTSVTDHRGVERAMICRTRFAPSPTGFLHIGGVRTALYCWLQARHHRGEFILRIEDTDRERSSAAAVTGILAAMEWLGLTYDQGPFYQSRRLERYQQVALQLIDSGHAYYCYESKETLNAMRAAALAAGQKPRYNGAARNLELAYRDDPNRVIRFKNPLSGVVQFDDRIKGNVAFANEELDDMVILRSDGYPTYNFAVVVDDWDMGITDVIRGDDHLNNTPRQINLYHALNAALPRYAHVPMILDSEGAKLSKRTGAADVLHYQRAGYLPNALINYLVRLGWSHGDQELFTRDELIERFDITNVNSNPARLDPVKLAWVNQHYLKTSNPRAIAPLLAAQLRQDGIEISDGPAAEDVVIALRDRVQSVHEMAEKARVWYQPLTAYDADAVAKHLHQSALEPLQQARSRLLTLTDWTVANVKDALVGVAADSGVGLGKVAQPLRVAITGTQVSPDIAYTVYLAGKEQAIARIDAALARIALLS